MKRITLPSLILVGFFLSLALVGARQAKPVKPPVPPAEALKLFSVPDDLQLDQLLTEPVVRKPVFFNFDERGRMWVMQYLQYPNPAGLKMMSRDRHWRAVYDKVPPPPPNHFKGQDKITIHEDTDGDGTYDKHTTFIDGLSIATAVARGRGGVWVLNPPYLLFYPDKNNDDIPDGPPVVHLEGFGLEDTHSVVNSLCWGPDGWLYAAQGSTVTGNVKRPADKTAVHSLGQHIWRYHPETRRYEIFAEGGGNAFGVEFDSKGRVYSGYNGGDTRGFHYVQGGYFRKGFEKHGDLSNPYAFGHFAPMKHHKVQRFTHNFIINEGSALPAKYTGHLFGVDPLASNVVEAEMSRDGSTWQSKDVGHPMTTPDTAFRPVDIKLGPDGAIYVADWSDDHVSHLISAGGHFNDKTGRIYRLKAKGAKAVKPIDLSKLPSEVLVRKLTDDPNRWTRQTALRLLGDRKDASLVPLLKKRIADSVGQPALECLWALNLSGGLDDATALGLLDHADPYVRLWTIRLLGDNNRIPENITARLIKLAHDEKDVEVRSQLACTLKRLPARDLLPIWRQLATHDEHVKDPHVPLLLWWALESKCDSDREMVLQHFEDSSLWRLPLVEGTIQSRLMRRFAQPGTQKDLLVCARLLRMAPRQEDGKRLLEGFEQAFTGRPLSNLPQELIAAMAARGGGSLALRVRQGKSDAVAEALKLAGDAKADMKQRLQLIPILGEIREAQAVPALIGALGQTDEAVRQAALNALLSFNDSSIGADVVKGYNSYSADTRRSAQTLLASRAAWSLQLLEAIDSSKIKADTVTEAVVRRMLVHKNEQLSTLVKKHFGDVKGATTAEMRKQIESLGSLVRKGPAGNPYAGKRLFADSCGKCHVLFGKGGAVGPDLTSYKRDDLDTMLLHVVNPSAEIREGFENYLVVTEDGRTLNGFLAEKDDKIVVLRGTEGQSIVIERAKIDEMRVIPVSLMPEGLLKNLSEEQVRDLFAYLRSTQPLPE